MHTYLFVFCLNCPVDLKDKKGRTALTFAAELGHPEVTSWLLKADADVSCPCIAGFATVGGGIAPCCGALTSYVFMCARRFAFYSR